MLTGAGRVPGTRTTWVAQQDLARAMPQSRDGESGRSVGFVAISYLLVAELTQKYPHARHGIPSWSTRGTQVAPPQDVRAPQDQAQDSAGAAPKGDEAVGANPWRTSRPPNTGTAAAGSGRVRKHLWLKEQTMQRCPRSSSLLARMRCLRARPQMRISSGSSHVNLAHGRAAAAGEAGDEVGVAGSVAGQASARRGPRQPPWRQHRQHSRDRPRWT